MSYIKINNCYEFTDDFDVKYNKSGIPIYTPKSDFKYLGKLIDDWDNGDDGVNSTVTFQTANKIEKFDRQKILLRETNCLIQYPIKKLFFVFGAGCDYTKSYEDILKEFKRMENIIMEELDIPYSTLKNIDSILKNYKGNELNFLLKYKNIRDTVEFVRELQLNSGLYEQNIHLKCYPYSTINITKSYLGLSPLKRFTRSGWRPSNILLFKTIREYTPIQPKTNAFMRFLSRGSAGGKKHSKVTRKKHF